MPIPEAVADRIVEDAINRAGKKDVLDAFLDRMLLASCVTAAERGIPRHEWFAGFTEKCERAWRDRPPTVVANQVEVCQVAFDQLSAALASAGVIPSAYFQALVHEVAHIACHRELSLPNIVQILTNVWETHHAH